MDLVLLAQLVTQLMKGMQCEGTIPRKFKVLDDDCKEIGGDTGLGDQGGEKGNFGNTSPKEYM